MRNARLARAFPLALLVAIAAPLAGCGDQREGATRVLVIGEDPQLVDPAAGPLSTAQSVLLSSAAQGLVRFDARGNIEPGLAERWNVSDDGLSYIFRLASGTWPNGDKITAEQVARMLRQQLRSASDNALKDSLGAIDEIVAMTDRVIEIRLSAPRPNLLELLAQPEFALVRNGGGAGPFEAQAENGAIRLERSVPAPDEEQEVEEELLLDTASAREAISAFNAGRADLVLGGTFVDLPYARAAELPRGALRFDPASGLFGLMPAHDGGLLAQPEVRRLLSQAIDRQAFVQALGVPGLLPRATLLEPGLTGIADPVSPQWTAVPLAERRPELIARARQLLGDVDPEDRVLRIALPTGPGADLLLGRLATDWGALGIKVERAAKPERADLKLVDAVAPSTSAAWFLRKFRCGVAAICSSEADELLEAARAAPVAAQRQALLHEAAAQMDRAQLFLPITAPIRWSLVSAQIPGFAGNRFATHSLTAIHQTLEPERGQ